MCSAVSAERPVADCWYAIAVCDDDIVQLRETWIDPYLTGICGSSGGKTGICLSIAAQASYPLDFTSRR
jgi:hypothetical protein